MMQIELYVNNVFRTRLWQSNSGGPLNASVPVYLKDGDEVTIRILNKKPLTEVSGELYLKDAHYG